MMFVEVVQFVRRNDVQLYRGRCICMMHPSNLHRMADTYMLILDF